MKIRIPEEYASDRLTGRMATLWEVGYIPRLPYRYEVERYDVSPYVFRDGDYVVVGYDIPARPVRGIRKEPTRIRIGASLRAERLPADILNAVPTDPSVSPEDVAVRLVNEYLTEKVYATLRMQLVEMRDEWGRVFTIPTLKLRFRDRGKKLLGVPVASLRGTPFGGAVRKFFGACGDAEEVFPFLSAGRLPDSLGGFRHALRVDLKDGGGVVKLHVQKFRFSDDDEGYIPDDDPEIREVGNVYPPAVRLLAVPPAALQEYLQGAETHKV